MHFAPRSYKIFIPNLYNAQMWQYYVVQFASRSYNIFNQIYMWNMVCSLHHCLTRSLYLTFVNNCGNMFCNLHQCLTKSLYLTCMKHCGNMMLVCSLHQGLTQQDLLYIITYMHTCGNMVCSVPQPPCMFAHRENTHSPWWLYSSCTLLN